MHAQYRQLLDSSPIGIDILSQNTNKRLFINRSLLKMFGASSSEDLPQQNITVTWVDQSKLQKSRDLHRRGMVLSDFVAERKRLDGTTWWVLMNSQIVHFEGEAARSVWHIDITERINAENQIRDLIEDLERRVEERAKKLNQSEALFRAVVDHSPAKIHIKDKGGRYTLINQQAEKLFNIADKDCHGKTSYDLFDKDMADLFHANDRAVIDTGKPIEVEEKFVDEDKVRTFLTTKFPIYDNGQLTGVGAIGTDITERILAEEKLQKALFDAEQANHSKSEFLATMSHELRTPLNAIIGFSDMMRGVYGPAFSEDKYIEYSENIYNSGEHLLSLINNILGISAIEMGKRPLNKVPLNLDSIIEYSTKLVAHSAENSGTKLVVDLPNDLPVLYADELAINQIVINLLVNAVKFSTGSGRVTISAGANGQEIFIRVSDEGTGIDPEVLPNVTAPFSRGHANAHLTQEGTGLGLAIVSLLVDAHNGQLMIDSEIAKGTTVTVLLPSKYSDDKAQNSLIEIEDDGSSNADC